MEFRNLKAQYKVLKQDIDQVVLEVCSSGNYIMGPQVRELEKQLAEYVGVKHCISCANGTDALQLALQAWGVGSGDAVFVPDLTFFASAEAVSFVGAVPIFIDIDERTFNMDPDSLKKAIAKVNMEKKYRAKAVIAVDLFGQPADYSLIRPICEQNGLYLLEDGAQGFGGRIQDKLACSFGDISTTSFFPAKPLGCYGDGGAVFTNNDKWAEIIRSLCVHGKGENKYDNIRIGTNSRLDTIQAGILLVKQKAFVEYELHDINKHAARYTQRLTGVVETPFVPEGFFSSWAQYSILLKTKNERDRLKEFLSESQIPTMIYYPVLMHHQTAFQHLEQQEYSFVKALKVCERILSLPISPYIQHKEIDLVCERIQHFLRRQ